MDRLKNIHPGEILKEEFLVPFEISTYRLAKETLISPTRISQIIKGNGRITTNTALRLSRYFKNSPNFWLGLQIDYELEKEANLIKKELNKIKPLKEGKA